MANWYSETVKIKGRLIDLLQYVRVQNNYLRIIELKPSEIEKPKLIGYLPDDNEDIYLLEMFFYSPYGAFNRNGCSKNVLLSYTCHNNYNYEDICVIEKYNYKVFEIRTIDLEEAAYGGISNSDEINENRIKAFGKIEAEEFAKEFIYSEEKDFQHIETKKYDYNKEKIIYKEYE